MELQVLNTVREIDVLCNEIQGWEVSRYSLGRAWIEAVLWLGLGLDR